MTRMYSTNHIKKCKAIHSSATQKLIFTNASSCAASENITRKLYKPYPVASDVFLLRNYTGWICASVVRCTVVSEYSTSAVASNTLVNLSKLLSTLLFIVGYTLLQKDAAAYRLDDNVRVILDLLTDYLKVKENLI